LPICGSFQISYEPVVVIKDEQIRGFSGEFCHECTRPCFGSQIDSNDPIILNLADNVDVRALEMGAQELAEGGRRRRVLHRCRGQM
jgi:hypothetical protein